MAHLLVTGGLGFIGSHLCERLLNNGHTVVALDNFTSPQAAIHLSILQQHAGFRLITWDITHPEFLPDLLLRENFSMVFHLAALAGVRQSVQLAKEYVSTNVQGSINLLEACRQVGVSKLIFTSSSSVYGSPEQPGNPSREVHRATNPLSPYAASKRAVELLCDTYATLHDMQIVILRLFSVYGPRQRPDLVLPQFATIMRRRQRLQVFGDGTSVRDYTYITDICDGLLLAYTWLMAQPEGPVLEIVNLGSGVPVPLNTVITTLETALGVRNTPRDTLPVNRADAEQTWAHLTRAQALLGYAPQVQVSTGIPLFVDWFLGQPI